MEIDCFLFFGFQSETQPPSHFFNLTTKRARQKRLPF